MANWKSSSSIWNNIAPVLNGGGYITKQAWNDFSDFPYILGLKRIIVHIDPVTPVCSNVSPFNLTASVMGGTWSGSGITNPGNGSFSPSAAGPGTHDIVYALGGQCGGTDTLLLTVNEAASLNGTATNESCRGAGDGSVTIALAGGTPPYTIHWSNGSTATSITSLEPGDYTVTVNDTKNCAVTQTYDVVVGSKDCGTPVIYIPNAFSPNGDGNNDVLLVRGRGISNLNLVIYDRWGNKVFETIDQTIGWDGTYKNLPLAAAIFGYTLEAVLSSGEKITRSGNITLVR
jgi:gliding motility-associated-like protein